MRFSELVAVTLIIVICLGMVVTGVSHLRNRTKSAAYDPYPDNLYPRDRSQPGSPAPPAEARKTDDAVELKDLGLVLRKVTLPESLGIPEFFLGETEVTNTMCRTFLEDTGRFRDDQAIAEVVARIEAAMQDADSMKEIARVYFSTASPSLEVKDPGSIWRNGAFPDGRGDHPVTLITVYQAVGFCDWLNQRYSPAGVFRLPLDEEWLPAAYGRDRKYPWGDEERTLSEETTSAVKSRPELRTPEGLYGMWGNVTEIVLSHSNGYGMTNRNFTRPVLTKWLGPSFATTKASPRLDYWGYNHSTRSRRDDMGFRVAYIPREQREKK